jgi:hypothetical protein
LISASLGASAESYAVGWRYRCASNIERDCVVSTYLVLNLAAVVAAVPITTLVLRHARQKLYRELSRRVAGGEIVAGVPANWLDQSNRPAWSGCLTIAPAGTLRWEPDKASATKRRATVREWDEANLTIKVVGRRRGFTGERYEVLHLTANDASVATFAVFSEVGPWHQRLGVEPYPIPE